MGTYKIRILENFILKLRFCRFARRSRAAYDLTDESVRVGGSHASLAQGILPQVKSLAADLIKIGMFPFRTNKLLIAPNLYLITTNLY